MYIKREAEKAIKNISKSFGVLLVTGPHQVGLKILMAFVMPENVHSAKVLLNNGFVQEAYTAEETNWGGHDAVIVDVYTLVTQS